MMNLARCALFLGFLAASWVGIGPRQAEACGCFTPPDPSVPIVQAGERILFAIEEGVVTAHIQIQYAGSAGEFGWLLPLPSVPTLELGTDELFAQLIQETQPKYRLTTAFEGNCRFGRGGFGSSPPSADGGTSGGSNSSGKGPLVIQDSIGPYDYAVLRGDSKDEMLKWLADNRYFVPVGTDQTVGNYLGPGKYFLALKLRSGQSAGDLQPVVVKYPSDYAMIPIELTSVGAQPNMGVQVWMLGGSRAIPRNYYHTVINDLAIDWYAAGRNYNDVVIKAVAEAPEKHSFLTEYAGTSRIMQDRLDFPRRFGDPAAHAAAPSAIGFVQSLQSASFPFSSQVTTILGRYIPMPPGLERKKITPAQFYLSIDYFLSDDYRSQFPEDFEGWAGINYQPQKMVDELWERVVKPTLAAGALFRKFPYLTRLYTTISPEDMNLDPVFSFNKDLPDVAHEHQATLTYYCGVLGSDDPARTPARLVTEQGWSVDYPNGTGNTQPPPPRDVAGSQRIEVLGEEGPPRVIQEILPDRGGCACRVASVPSARSAAAGVGLALLGAALAMARARRRGRS